MLCNPGCGSQPVGFNSTILFLLAAVLLLAKTDAGPGQVVEVRSSNSPIEITGSDIGGVRVNDSSNATIRNVDGRTVVEAENPSGNAPLKVQIPRNATLDISTSNGAIRVSGVVGAMRLATSNGGITVQDAGGSGIHAHTSNGPIEVVVPQGLNANVSARTSNGRIQSNLDIVTHRLGDNYLEGKLGNGGPAIDLQTSNGPIDLRTTGDRENVVSTFKPGEVK